MSKQKQAYLQYLESGHWRDLREQAFKRDGYKCVWCGSSRYRRLRGHHVKYAKDLRQVPLKHILTLCQSCHDRHHKEQRAARRERRKEQNRMAKGLCRVAWLILCFDAR